MKRFMYIALAASLMTPSAFAKESLPLPTTPPKLNLSAPMPGNLFVELAKAINPAVVNISTTAMPKMRQGRDPMLEMLEQLYGFRMQQPQQQKRPQQMGLGTGFIIREDGLIVTNNHVIAGADTINVQLSDKDKDVYEATVVGRDERSDIALIKIEPKKKLPAVVLGSSATLEVGEWVAAFGNPFGHGHSVTKGIVSSKGRDISEINKIPLIQTDASINPGNSGGPLVNTKGEVIAVNSAIDARAQGIGFAIPIDEVKAMIPILEAKGRIARGYIGAQLGELDPQAAEYLGLGDAKGAVITSLDPQGPAAKGGMKTYDIVTEFNGKAIGSSLGLIDAVSDSPIGQAVKAKVLRDGKTVNLTLTIKERPEDIQRAKPVELKGQKAPYNLGFSVINPNDQLRAEWGLPTDLNQPLVLETERGSIAAASGLRVGDVILDVNKKTINNAKDVLNALKKNGNTLRVARNARIIIIQIK